LFFIRKQINIKKLSVAKSLFGIDMLSIQNQLNLAKECLIANDKKQFTALIRSIEDHENISSFQKLELLILQMLYLEQTDFFGSKQKVILKANELLMLIGVSFESEFLHPFKFSKKPE
jgi:hypothetical protein